MEDKFKALIFFVIVLIANYFVSNFVSDVVCASFGYCDNFWWGFICFFPVAYVVGYVWYGISLVINEN